MMSHGRHTIFLKFALFDGEGQYDEEIAIVVDRMKIHGVIENGFYLDIYHLDGSAERRVIGGNRRGGMMIGKPGKRIISVDFQSVYPSARILTKSQFHALLGVERVLNEMGHFVEVIEA